MTDYMNGYDALVRARNEMAGDLAEEDAKRDRMADELRKMDDALSVYRQRYSITEGIRVDDIQKCVNNPEAIKLIARKSDNVLVVKEARRLLIQSGRASRDGAGPTIYSYLASHADEWKKLEKGRYRLIEPKPITALRQAGSVLAHRRTGTRA